MLMRPPAIPLITVDPYFSVWSFSDRLYDDDTYHWTGSPNTLKGIINIDGEVFRFMGKGTEPVIEQIFFNMNALTTFYTFANDKITLNVEFFTPLFPDDLYMMSRPVSYMRVSYSANDNNKHTVSVSVTASEELCIDKKNAMECSFEKINSGSLSIGKIGSVDQNVLSRSGDDLRIDWGYFYLAVNASGKITEENDNGMKNIKAEISLTESKDEIILFAYDDIKCINYFGNEVEAYWKNSGKTILEVINEAYEDCENTYEKCVRFSVHLEAVAELSGGEYYSDLLDLSFRQVIAAHKLATDNDGNVIFISKECFSNGCAATVDVTYPSSPFFIYYNTELLKGMLRPIFKFSDSDEWQFDFAPHDVGQYPLLLGQVYGKNHEAEGKYKDYQMPVEECGNMLIMMANISLKDGNTDFADPYMQILEAWVQYLVKYGMDPENQLCTDDFAGHLAHNCNLSLKAIMGIAGYSLILRMKGNEEAADEYFSIAKDMADNWVKTAASPDGSFRLTFDRIYTFSMKYNMIWDKIWHTGLFAPSVFYSEFCSYKKHIYAYGLPLDNRKNYTKSDWLLWVACFAPTLEEFSEFIYPMWNCYNVTPSRLPMTDWYDTVTSQCVGFRHRSVQGGLFIRLLFNLY